MSTTEKAAGLTAEEAKEFHKAFMQGFVVFTGIAVVAHFLVWSWRPWAQSAATTQTSLLDHLHHVTALLG